MKGSVLLPLCGEGKRQETDRTQKIQNFGVPSSWKCMTWGLIRISETCTSTRLLGDKQPPCQKRCKRQIIEVWSMSPTNWGDMIFVSTHQVLFFLDLRLDHWNLMVLMKLSFPNMAGIVARTCASGGMGGIHDFLGQNLPWQFTNLRGDWWLWYNEQSELKPPEKMPVLWHQVPVDGWWPFTCFWFWGFSTCV